jgi:tight adherence protein B
LSTTSGPRSAPECRCPRRSGSSLSAGRSSCVLSSSDSPSITARRAASAFADPVADRIVESLRIARDVGGSDLGRLLRTLSQFLRDDARTRAELETRQGWTIAAARLALAAPWFVLAVLSLRPQTVTAYDTAAGVAVLGCGAAVSWLAYRVMLHVARLPEDPRVLR